MAIVWVELVGAPWVNRHRSAAIHSRATKTSVSPYLALPRASHPMAARPQPRCSALQVADSLRNTVLLGKPWLENIKQRPGASPPRDTCLWRRHGNAVVRRGCHRPSAAAWLRTADPQHCTATYTYCTTTTTYNYLLTIWIWSDI